MTSSDDHPGRITPDLLQRMLTTVDVAGLDRPARDPWAGDPGRATRLAAEFGTVAIPVVQDGQVLFGWEHVAAEQQQPQDDGRLLVLDVSDLHWPPERVWALVAGLRSLTDHTEVDRGLLAELLADIGQLDMGWLDAAGWDTDALEQLLAAPDAALGAVGSSGPPSLDQLEAEHGTFTDDEHREFWPSIKVQVPPTVFRRWQEAMDDAPGSDDHQRVDALLTLASHTTVVEWDVDNGGVLGAVVVDRRTGEHVHRAYQRGDGHVWDSHRRRWTTTTPPAPEGP